MSPRSGKASIPAAPLGAAGAGEPATGVAGAATDPLAPASPLSAAGVAGEAEPPAPAAPASAPARPLVAAGGALGRLGSEVEPELAGVVAGGLFGLLSADADKEPAMPAPTTGGATEPVAALSSSAMSGSSFAQATLQRKPLNEIQSTRQARFMTFILRLHTQCRRLDESARIGAHRVRFSTLRVSTPPAIPTAASSGPQTTNNKLKSHQQWPCLDDHADKSLRVARAPFMHHAQRIVGSGAARFATRAESTHRGRQQSSIRGYGRREQRH